MPTQINELRDFQQFLAEKLSNGGADLSPEEAVDEWRRLNPDPESFDKEVAAIQQALDDIANGDPGTPFEEFDREFRKRHNIPAKP
jgi:hypothetical protein